MEEVKENPLETGTGAKRQEWVSFDDDSQQRSGKEAATAALSNGQAAVLPVENGPQLGAIIEPTQTHVAKDRRITASPSGPHPTPRASGQNPKASPRASLSPDSGRPAQRSPIDRQPTSPLAATAPNHSKRAATTPSETAIQMALQPQSESVDLHCVPLSEGNNGADPSKKHNVLTQTFANGDIIATLLPLNERCPWITRATFRPELVPEELMAQQLTLTVEEYLSAMEVLVNDLRFNLYNTCYKRILMGWIMLGFLALLCLLFSGVKGISLFGGGVIWLFLNAIGIFVCMWFKIKLRYHMERCLAQVNKYFYKHKILLGIDDRGKISCHKVHLIFIYFDCTDCVKHLNQVIETEDKSQGPEAAAKSSKDSFHSRMDIDDSDIIITGSTNTRVPRNQKGELLLLRYSQRWVKEYVCRRLDLNVDVHDRAEGEAPAQPRHCAVARCPCQFIEEHLRFKPRGKICGCHLFDF